MAQRKIFNFNSVILEEMTKEKEGYTSDRLGISSNKFIYATCRFCGLPSRIRKGFFIKSGSACHKECKIKEQSLAGSPFAKDEVKKKIEQTNISKYGVSCPTKNSDVARKISLTKLRKKAKSGVFFDIQKEVEKKKFYTNEIFSFVKTLVGDLCFIDNCDNIVVPSKSFAVCFNSGLLCSEAVLEHTKARTMQVDCTKKYEVRGQRLFHVFDKDWIEKRSQVESIICNALGCNKEKIAARKCVLNHDGVPIFLDLNHIQGSHYGVVKWFNLVYDGEVVSCMTASKHHRQNVEGNPIILGRFCSKAGSNVQGGASKLFESFKKWALSLGYDRVISWSDSSYAIGGLYSVLGFSLKSEYPPDYFYWDFKKKIYKSKQSQKKSVVACPIDMTEREWAKQRGLYRVWDCGKKMWEYSLF